MIVIWTDDMIDELKRMHADGYSASQVASKFGVTRNSICGKWHRLGLKKQADPRPEPKPVQKRSRSEDGAAGGLVRKLQVQRGTMSKVVPIKVVERIAVATEKCVGLFDLRAHHCRYPFGNSAPYMFCGATATHGSYCAEHHEMCTRPNPKKAAA